MIDQPSDRVFGKLRLISNDNPADRAPPVLSFSDLDRRVAASRNIDLDLPSQGYSEDWPGTFYPVKTPVYDQLSALAGFVFGFGLGVMIITLIHNA